MPSPQYEATLKAVARLDGAIRRVQNEHRPESGASSWTPELTRRLVDGMQACRWFIAAGFDPPAQFGSWLRRNLEEAGLGPPDGRHGDFDASWVWHAADAVDDLGDAWQPDWTL
jgi:hypothetical protein